LNFERPLHSRKVTQIFGLYFYENSDSGTALTDKKKYLAMLQQVFNDETFDNERPLVSARLCSSSFVESGA